jgi:hypothetical protein
MKNLAFLGIISLILKKYINIIYRDTNLEFFIYNKNTDLLLVVYL